MNNRNKTNLLFVHDAPLYQEGTTVYSGGTMTADLWQRNYLPNFDRMTVIARRSRNVKDKQIISSIPGKVDFNLVEEYSSLPNLFLNFPKILKKINSGINNADLIFIRLPSVLGFIAGISMIRKKRIFMVEQVGNCKEAFSNHSSIIAKISAWGLERINRFIVYRSPFSLFVTNTKLQEIYKTKGVSIGISDVVLPYVLKKEELDTSRFTDQTVKIALLGTFEVRYKGHDTLLEALHLLPDNARKQIKLYFLGTGNPDWIHSKVKRLGLEDNLAFIGYKKGGEEIFATLKQMSLYTQPSYTEGMPRALLEAMAMGCPCLGSKVGGIPDLLEDNQLHSPRNSKELAAQLLHRINNRQILIEESYKNLEKAASYQVDILARKRYDFYESIKRAL